jgi:UDP-N-acetylglucosamine 3-dehydrogenase
VKAPLKAIVAGLGVMGAHHLRLLHSMRDIDVVAVVDPSAERRADADALAPGARTYALLEDALAGSGADLVCLATPPETLPELAHLSIDAGLPVLVEKPLATSEDPAIDVVRHAEERGLPLAVGLVERCNPAVMALAERLRTGAAGRVYQIHARRLSPFPFRESRAGVALDLATHDIDVIRALTGSEIARVYAETARRSDSSTEDLVSVSLRLDSGTTGVLEVNWLTPTKVRELTVTGELGMFAVNYLTQDLTFWQNPRANIEWDTIAVMRGTGEGDMTRYALDRREPLRVQWEAFLACVREEAEAPAATGWDAVAALSTARAIQRSGRDHEPQAPDYRALDSGPRSWASAAVIRSGNADARP